MHARARFMLPAAVTLAALLVVGPAFAAWPIDPKLNLQIPSTSNQTGVTSVSDGAGGAIVAWVDARNGLSNTDIYAQRVSASGALLWSGAGVPVCQIATSQYQIVMTPDGAGGAILAWVDSRLANAAIFTQKVNASGVPQWTDGGVQVSLLGGNQNWPAMTTDGAGGAIITFLYTVGIFETDVYAQRISSAGARAWGIFSTGISRTMAQRDPPVIATDGANGAYVVWADYRGLDGDLFGQRVNAAGAVQWAVDGQDLTVANGNQYQPVMTPDGLGGAVLAWYDTRNGSNDVYGQHLVPGGELWSPVTGVEVARGTALNPTITGDGAGGAIVAWTDFRNGNHDVYAQHVTYQGQLLWGAYAIGVCTDMNYQAYPIAIADGTGGAIITWSDFRNGFDNDIYAQRVLSGGALQWTPGGVGVATATGDQSTMTIATDGANGAIVAWDDYRTAAAHTYAMRVERFGLLGSPEPTMVSANDVPGDQGGFVHLIWNASPYDANPIFGIGSYNVWRRVTTTAAQLRLRKGAHLLAAGEAVGDASGLLLRVTPDGAQSQYWEFLATLPARGYPGYSFAAATLQDSLPTSNPYTNFMVDAAAPSGPGFWSAMPESGYSVDDLPPGIPAPFTAQFVAGTARLHWDRNTEADLAGYRLYRGPSASFTPGPTNLVATRNDTGYVDVAGAPFYYKLSAVDDHGNESNFAIIQPAGTTDVLGPGVPREAWLARPVPNPAREGTVLRFAIPRDGPVSLALFDEQGRRVRTLMSCPTMAGEHIARWDGRDDAGRVLPSAIYFCRLQTEGRMLTNRLALVR